jgi:hypothetical protein
MTPATEAAMQSGTLQIPKYGPFGWPASEAALRAEPVWWWQGRRRVRLTSHRAEVWRDGAAWRWSVGDADGVAPSLLEAGAAVDAAIGAAGVAL